MEESIKGILSHRKLMEVKNCPVIASAEVFERMAEQKFNFYISVVAGSLKQHHSGFLKDWFYGEKQAFLDASWMFPDRESLLKHLIFLEGKSEFVVLSPKELSDFTLVHQAAIATRVAKEVVDCFKYSDQVIVDRSSGFNVDWLLKNAFLLKRFIEEEEGENNDN